MALAVSMLDPPPTATNASHGPLALACSIAASMLSSVGSTCTPKCIYIDPPFNTGQAFAQYDDGIEHSIWLSLMRDRLDLLRRLLRPDGSIWVHCDDNEQAYLRVAMDEVFGRENFITTIIWQKVDSPNDN